MRRRLLLLLIFLLVFALLPTSATAATEFYKSKGPFVLASFVATAPDNSCISNAVGVSATENRIQEGAGKPEIVSEAQIHIWIYNGCTNEPLINVLDSATLSPEAFDTLGNLKSATLNTTVDVYDTVSETTLPVLINLTWTGTGPISKEGGKESGDYGKCKINFSWKGISRGAVATGSVTVMGVNRTPELSNYALMADTKQSETLINCD
jgi:hypothetical protein